MGLKPNASGNLCVENVLLCTYRKDTVNMIIENYIEFNRWLDEAMLEPNLLDDFVDSYRKHKRRVYLYGAGHACEFYIRYFRKMGIPIAGIIDKDTKKIGQIFYDNLVVSLESALRDDDIDIVIAAPSIYRELLNEISDFVELNHIHAFDVEQYEYYNNSSSSVKEYICSHREALYEIYRVWADDKSRDTMLNVLKARLTANLDYISCIWEPDQYWPDNIICFSNDEVIVECGSCDGKTLKELTDKLNNRFKSIYCFEPDIQCGAMLTEVIKEIGTDRIKYIPKGTYSEETELKFCADSVESGLSYVDEKGSIIIPVTTIDKVVDEPVSYIKMDIEGSELATLKGAETTIKTYRPKLAVCVYHKNEDMTAIPQILKSFRSDYRFYLRHHNCNVTETVLYAV